jgi:Zn-dependent protease with chaperone function
MIQLPNVFMFAAFVLMGPFGVHHEMASLVLFSLMACGLAVALAYRRSSQRQSLALLGVLTVMFYESLQSITRWLHIELMEIPAAGAAEAHLFSFFTFNVGLAVIGAAAAAIVAISLEVRKTCLPLAKLFPDMVFATAPTELTSSVARLSKMAGIAPPNVSLIDSGDPAAFITRSRQGYVLAVSVGLVESLSQDELEACIAHELSHVKNNDFALRSFATSARVALFAHPLSHFIEPALYRAREFLADKTAVQLVGGRESLISALGKIGESQDYISANSGTITAACLFNSASKNRFVRLFDKHPNIESRVRALRELNPVE